MTDEGLKKAVRPARHIARAFLRPFSLFSAPSKTARRNSYTALTILLIMMSAFIILQPRKAQAQCGEWCACVAAYNPVLRAQINREHDLNLEHVTTQFQVHRGAFIIRYWFKEHVLAAMMMMTEQFTAVAMHQMMMVGSLLDARQELYTQQTYQQLRALAHKNYQPSNGMCELGTLARNIGASYEKSETTAVMLSQISQNRQLGKRPNPGSQEYAQDGTTASVFGKGADKIARVNLVGEKFCNPADNNGRIAALSCTGSLSNLDVDYTRLVDYPLTIPFDLTTGGTGQHIAPVVAMTSHLYGNDVFEPVSKHVIGSTFHEDRILDVRAVVAKRSVAQNSFNMVVGMKASGTNVSGETRKYMRVILQQLGLIDEDPDNTDQDEVTGWVGQLPSYHAQMEFLTKTIYQRPEFYTNLYDKPANVDRKGAALRAISLMQDMDRYKSQLRNEMLLSVLLEMELKKEHDRVQSNINVVTD